MHKLISTTALILAIAGPVAAGLHVQVPQAANDATNGTEAEGAPANASAAGLADPDNNNSEGRNSTGADNASQKGEGRGQGRP